jgi:hypothetical protein
VNTQSFMRPARCTEKSVNLSPRSRALIETSEEYVVSRVVLTTHALGPAIELLRQVIADAAIRGLAIHRYATNGNHGNGGYWIRTYIAHPADLPRPRLSRHCQGPSISINRESPGADSMFYRSLQWLHVAILAKPTSNPSGLPR